MRGEHDELEIFLETRLISSRVDQKLSLKGRNTLVLKRELARRSWAIDAFVGAVFKHRGSGSLGISCGFNSAANRLEFGFEKSFKIGHDLRAIDHDRASIVSQMLWK